MAKAISVHEKRDQGKTSMVQVDMTEPDTGVEVLVDHHRKVLYVNVEGYCILRICRVEQFLVDERGSHDA